MPTRYKECPIDKMFSIKSLFTFFRRTFPHDFYFSGESHDFTEIVCVIGGKIGVTANKNVCALSTGQMIVHAPNEFHSLWPNNNEAEAIVFSFLAEDFPTLEKSVFTLTAEQISELCNLYKRVTEIFLFREGFLVAGIHPHREAEAAILIKQLEILLLNIWTSGNAAVPSYSSQGAANYVRIVSAMEEALGGPLNIDQLASTCNLSVSAIEKTIHRYMGCGAITYFNNLRMQRAVSLLEEGKSVKEVAAELGFSGQNYFSSAFKRWAQRSPSSFRKQ